MTDKEIQKAFEGRWRIKAEQNPAAWVKGVKQLCQDFFQAAILLSEKDHAPRALPPGSPGGKTHIETRAEAFRQQVQEFAARYPTQLLQDFFSYWSEPNKSKTKMRFEMQKTWELSRRLATWARNDFNHYATNTKPTIEQQRREKLASILTE